MNTKLLTTALVLGLGASAFAAESATLKYRYSFDPAGYDEEGHLTFTDSVGGTTGVCYGNAYIDDIYDPETYEVIGSQMILSGDGNVASFTDGSFAALPANIMSGFSSFSIEMWVKCTGDKGNWMRLYDFGNCFTTTDELTGETLINGGHNYTMMTWRSASGTLRSGERLYWDEDTQWREDVVDAAVLPIGDDVFHHIVYTYDSETQTGKIYTDGAIAGSGSQEFNPTQFGDMTNMWLGKPQFRDYYFQGNYDEFRIYQGVLSAAEVSNNYKLGANKLGDLGTLESIEVTAPKNTIYKNEHLTLTVNATYSTAGVIDVTGDCTFANTNPEVASITDGAILGLAAGTAKFTADYLDKSATFEVTVVDEAPTLELVHRYSFNGNANDSVGTANGTLENGAAISGGKLVLTPADSAAANGQYVSLPLENYFDGQLAATIEVWAQIDNVNQAYNWCRLWQFSSSVSSFYLTPRGSTVINSYIKTPYGENEIVGSGYAAGMEEGVMAHLVVVADGYNKKYSIYRDGNLLVEKSLDLVPADLGAFTLARIGADGDNPGLFGKIDEMRMYNGAMTVEDVRLSYASGPDTLPSETGDLQSVYVKLVNGTTSMIESTSSPFNVYADYANVKGVILDPAETTVYSVDENIVSVENGKLYANEVGTATLNITYQNFAGSSTITVTAMPAATLTHRYSFTSDAADSVGGANGTLYGAAQIVNGTLQLATEENPAAPSGADDPNDAVSYVRLPENLISDHESVTIEAWIRIDKLQMWARLFDFGGKEGNSGTKYMFMAPYNGTTGGSSFTFVTAGQGAAEQQLTKGGYYLPEGEMVHVVMTLLGDANLARMYVNGMLIAEADDITNNPSKIGAMPFCYLGRSLYASDYTFTGVIDEFRTWKGVLTTKQVAANYVAGPDQIAGDLGELEGIRVVSDVPSAAPGLNVNFTVYGDYANMKDVPINSLDGLKISIDNPAFTLLDDHTYTCATIAKGNLIAAYSGFEATAAIETYEAPATLVHRYSFNGDTKDSVGNVDGENNYSMEITNGQLIMDGSSPVVLPQGVMDIVAGNAFTLETWIEINQATAGNWGSFNFSFFNEEDYEHTYNEFALGAQPDQGQNINSTW
ncbi:MAG: LamG domain-containing protein, partial [Verrucomicrobia bacterium]|nr:LamG domain-containing protein [Verrucomicrobiota bacterium]